MFKKFMILNLCLLFITGCSVNSPKDPQTATNTMTRNNHDYTFDVVSGATNGKHEGVAYRGDEKWQRMMWSGRPEIGVVTGDYYFDSLDFNGGYIATVMVVAENNALQLVEFDEISPQNYYAPEWANRTKRTSGYANWQMDNGRTDTTLVTIVNAMTFLEYQMMTQNSLVGEFNAPAGSSTSLRGGFEPVVNKIAPRVAKPSNLYYIGVTEAIGDGLYARLGVIYNKQDQSIYDVIYDEYFDDNPEAIADPALQQFYRESKYHAREFETVTQQHFHDDVNALKAAVKQHQTLDIPIDNTAISPHYRPLAERVYQLSQEKMSDF
ncbi:hypothetical protein [Erysipelothrix aquatica]|uniref:hypothetical protein n=1 Tax=Erysipelothrix aquatica TaxID=2683714 RepID=UPI001356F3DE|nr:hypothetical protein [Erysipelothrix aquatica]